MALSILNLLKEGRDSGQELSGADLMALTVSCVYIWFRGEQCLYVGATGNFGSRICGHNYIGVVDAVQPTDTFYLIPCDNPFNREGEFIDKLKPKYNTPPTPNADGEIPCILCKESFKPKRKWQVRCGHCK